MLTNIITDIILISKTTNGAGSPVPTVNKALSSWCVYQRSRNREGKMSSERENQLREIGFDFDPHGKSENVRIQQFSLGTLVSKVFQDPMTGKNRPFSGYITDYDQVSKLYEITYEDGDEEVVGEEEVTEMMRM